MADAADLYFDAILHDNNIPTKINSYLHSVAKKPHLKRLFAV